MLKLIHSYLAYFVLVVLLIAVFRALSGFILKKEYKTKMFQFALSALILSHIQLLIGMLLYFNNEKFLLWFELGVLEVMRSDLLRLYLVEHPVANILAITLITIGYSKHKRNRLSIPKYKTLATYYTIALILVLSSIPWNVWPN